MKNIVDERLGRAQYRVAINCLLKSNAVGSFTKEFPNWGSYANAVNTIYRSLRKHAVKWKYNRISVPINELDGPVDVLRSFRRVVINKNDEKKLLASQLGLDIPETRTTKEFYNKYHKEIVAWSQLKAGDKDEELRKELEPQRSCINNEKYIWVCQTARL